MMEAITGTITEVGTTHAGVIAALHAACFDEAWDERAVADILAMPGTAGLIGNNEIVKALQGFTLFRFAADEAEILSIGVIEDGRRQGLAGRLLQASIEHSRRRGVSKMFLEAAEDNIAARAFYEKASFAIAGRRPGYYSRATGKSDALIYSREITGK